MVAGDLEDVLLQFHPQILLDFIVLRDPFLEGLHLLVVNLKLAIVLGLLDQFPQGLDLLLLVVALICKLIECLGLIAVVGDKRMLLFHILVHQLQMPDEHIPVMQLLLHVLNNLVSKGRLPTRNLRIPCLVCIA